MGNKEYEYKNKYKKIASKHKRLKHAIESISMTDI